MSRSQLSILVGVILFTGVFVAVAPTWYWVNFLGLTKPGLTKPGLTKPDCLEVNFSDFLVAVKSGQIKQAMVDGEKLFFQGVDYRNYITVVPYDTDTDPLLDASSVQIANWK